MTAWLTIEQAASRVERSTDTIYRWGRRGLVTLVAGRVLERQLLEADRTARQRRGRPRALKDLERREAPIEVGRRTIGVVTVDVKHGTIVSVRVTDPAVLALLESPRPTGTVNNQP